MLGNDFMNTKRKTFDVWELQEYVQGCGWEESHTDTGYYQMLGNKAAYEDNQRRGGNAFKYIKRRLKKADHSPDQLNQMEREELKAKIEYLTKRIFLRPDSVTRNRSRRWQIEQAQKRLKVLMPTPAELAAEIHPYNEHHRAGLEQSIADA